MKKILIACLLLLSALSVGNGVAQAHSSVVATNPADGSALDKGPSQAFVTFNEALQTKFAAMTVVGPDGNIWSTGDPTIQGATLSIAVNELGPIGKYTINYRATSADGHTISGSSAFTLTQAGNGTPGPAASATSASQANQDSGSISLWYFIIGAVIVLGTGLFLMLRRAGGPK